MLQMILILFTEYHENEVWPCQVFQSDIVSVQLSTLLPLKTQYIVEE
jgi:hypothetical protein